MTAIYKRELKSYFYSMTGYLVSAFLLAFVGIYFTYYNLLMGYSTIGYALSYSLFIFMLVIPVLTMKVFAEEQKQKTDQLLLTAPVSVIKIVSGKYLAMVTVFAIPVFIIALYPIVLTAFGPVALKPAYVSILGYFLFGAAAIAIGLFVSTITESQVIAAVITFGILLASNLMSGIQSLISESSSVTFASFTIVWLIICYIFYCMNRNPYLAGAIGAAGEIILIVLYFVKSELFSGTLQAVMDKLSLQEQMNSFFNNILDLGAVVYYLSVIFLFLFLAVQAIQKRRWS